MDRKTIKWANNYGLPLEEVRYVKCPMDGGRQKMDNVRFLPKRRKMIKVRFLTKRRKRQSKTRHHLRK